MGQAGASHNKKAGPLWNRLCIAFKGKTICNRYMKRG